MQISYGEPGHRGVTHLMAVGADEYGSTDTAKVVKYGGMAAGLAAVIGALTNRPALSNIGLGATAALIAVHLASTRARTVSVT